jgi:hypothetical protein
LVSVLRLEQTIDLAGAFSLVAAAAVFFNGVPKHHGFLLRRRHRFTGSRRLLAIVCIKHCRQVSGSSHRYLHEAASNTDLDPVAATLGIESPPPFGIDLGFGVESSSPSYGSIGSARSPAISLVWPAPVWCSGLICSNLEKKEKRELLVYVGFFLQLCFFVASCHKQTIGY